MVASELPRYSYTVDSEDRLRWVSPTWLAFARENGASELTAENVLGRSVWSYIADEPTRELYGVLLRQIRHRGVQVMLPFRCDSPRLRRFMRLTMRPLNGDGPVRFDGVLVKTESRRPVRLLDAAAPRSSDTLTLCSLCQRALIRGRSAASRSTNPRSEAEAKTTSRPSFLAAWASSTTSGSMPASGCSGR